MGISTVVTKALPLLLLAASVAAQSICSQWDAIGDIYMKKNDSATIPMSAGFTCTQNQVAPGKDCCNLGAVGYFLFWGSQNLTTGTEPKWIWTNAVPNFPNSATWGGAALEHAEGCSPASQPYWSICVPVGRSGQIIVTPNLQCRVGTAKSCSGDASQYEGVEYEVCGASFREPFVNGLSNQPIPEVQVGFAQLTPDVAKLTTTNPAAVGNCVQASAGAARTGASIGGLCFSLAIAVVTASLL